MDLELAGMRALVTGASSGLGAAAARVLSAEGARVAIVARDEIRLATYAEEIAAVPLVADLTDPQSAAQVVEDTVHEFGGLDLLLANGGAPPAGDFAELTDELWQQALDRTFWATIRLIRSALPPLGSWCSAW